MTAAFFFFFALKCLLREWQSAIYHHLGVTSVSESAWKRHSIPIEDRNHLFVVLGHTAFDKTKVPFIFSSPWGRYTAVITPLDARSASETLPCTLQGTRYSAWPWCGCFSSTEPGSEEAAVGRESAEFQERASLIFTAHEGDAGVPEQPGGRERWGNQEKKKKKEDAFEIWAGEWSQEGKWGDGGEKMEVDCSLVWQHHCHCLEGEKEAGLHRERESLCSLTCF